MMKKIKIISTLIAFLLSFPCHFLYELFPNTLFSIIFPINESVWEHMKIIYTSLMLTSIIEYIIIRYKNINVNNFLFSYSITGIFGIIIYLIMYLPLELIFGHSSFLAIILLLIAYIISEIFNYYLLKLPKLKNSNILGIIIIIIVYFVFATFTYSTPKLDIFKDPNSNNYGIQKED